MERKAISGIILTMLLTSMLTLAFDIQPLKGAPAPHHSWPMFRYNARRTGYTMVSRGPLTNNTLWITPLNESIVYSSPAVANGRVFIGAGDSVWCLNETTGAVIWKYTTGSRVSSSPAVANGRVFIASHDNYLYCLNYATGALIWRYKTAGIVWSSPVVTANRVIIGSNDDKVYCLDAVSGALHWSFTTFRSIESSAAILEDRVYIGSNDGNLYCLNFTTGSLIWAHSIGTAIRSTPAIGYEVGVGSDNGYFYAIDAITGRLKWRSPYLGGAILSSAATTGYEFYVSTMYGSVYALDASGVIWNTPTGPIGPHEWSSPALDSSGYLYVGRYGAVLCLSVANGAIVWTYNTSAHVTSSPAIADGMLFVGDEDGRVYCFGKQPGDVDAIAVWQHIDVKDWDIWYSIWDETSGRWWTPTGAEAAPIPMPPHAYGDDIDPAIAFDHRRNCICVWSHQNATTGDYDIWFSRWIDPLRTWTTPEPVATIKGNDYDPAIAFDENGWAIAIWVHGFLNGTRVMYYSLCNGTHWGPAGLLARGWGMQACQKSHLQQRKPTSQNSRRIKQ